MAGARPNIMKIEPITHATQPRRAEGSPPRYRLVHTAMPKEINRMVTDGFSNWFFTTSEVANVNLRRSGVADDRILFVGYEMIDTLPDEPGKLLLGDPQPCLVFNHLVRHAKGVITDSGGVTEETTVLGVPCVTLRDSTERPEMVTLDTNELIGTDPAALGPTLDRLFAGEWKHGRIPDQRDGRTGARIAAQLERMLIG